MSIIGNTPGGGHRPAGSSPTHSLLPEVLYLKYEITFEV